MAFWAFLALFAATILSLIAYPPTWAGELVGTAALVRSTSELWNSSTSVHGRPASSAVPLANSRRTSPVLPARVASAISLSI